MAKTMKTILIKDVLIESRQRENLGDLDLDFANIKELGLIQPIVLENVGKTNRLIAGGRRLAWLAANGYDTLYHGVTCDPERPGYVLSYELTDLNRAEAELYENVKRQSLSWQEECKAIALIHRRRWIINKAEALAWSQQHTGRLLGIKDAGKVGYALQIADELKAHPDGEMAKLENYTLAVKFLNARSEEEARKEQDRRRAAQLSTEAEQQPALPGTESEPSLPKEEEHVTIWLSRMVFHGKFDKIAKDQLAPGMFSCAILTNKSNLRTEANSVVSLLKVDGVVIWLPDEELAITSPPYLSYIGHPVIWNVLDEEPDPSTPFRDNLRYIYVFTKGNPTFIAPSPTSVVSSALDSEGNIPLAVLDFLLKAVTINGDSILMPSGGPLKRIAILGRHPVAIIQNEAEYSKQLTELKDYYSLVYQGTNLEFK